MFKKYLHKVWYESALLNNSNLKSLIDPAREARILDLGCGTGELIIERASVVKNPQIYAMEINPTHAKKAKKLGIRATRRDIEKGLPFKSNFFDIVSANQIIEHLVNVDYFVEEVFRVLKPKGYALISTENLSSWHNILALILGWQAFSQHISTKKNIGNPLKLNLTTSDKSYDSHIKIFTPRGLTELLEMNNLRAEKFYGAGYYPFKGTLSKIFSKIDPTHAAFIGIKARKMEK